MTGELYSYSKEIVCVLPFVIDRSLLIEYEEEIGITNGFGYDATNQIEIVPTLTGESNIGDVEEIATEEDVSMVEPDLSENEDNVIDKYSIIDGIPRLLVDEINSSKMLIGINYDIMVALLNQCDMDNPYTTFSTNIEASSQIFRDIFAANYLIYGEVTKFNASLSKNETIEIAQVEMTINLLDLLTDEITTLTISRENIESAYRGEMYLANDAYFLESALGKATESVLEEVVDVLIAKLETQYLEATIIRLGDNSSTFYINVGKSMGVAINNIFYIYEQTFVFAGISNEMYHNVLSNVGSYSIQGNISNQIDYGRTETITNKVEEVRFTSNMLADYLRSISINAYVGQARVTKVYDNFSELKIYTTTNTINKATTNIVVDGSNQTIDYIPTGQEVATNFTPRLLMKAVFNKK